MNYILHFEENTEHVLYRTDLLCELKCREMSNWLILISVFCGFFFHFKVQQFSEKSFLLQLLKTHENALERQCSEITNQRNMLLQTFVSLRPLRKIYFTNCISLKYLNTLRCTFGKLSICTLADSSVRIQKSIKCYLKTVGRVI